jgi:tetratricopeptide (TPR) repeat protein
LAVDAFRAGRYDESLRQLDQLETVRPRHAPAGLLRTQAHLALGDYRAAAASLRQALDLLPADRWGLIVENFSDYYPDPARLADHLQRLGEHAGRNPSDVDARLLLGYEYSFLGHRELASAELTRAATADPSDALIGKLRSRFGDFPPPDPASPPSAGRRAF